MRHRAAIDRLRFFGEIIAAAAIGAGAMAAVLTITARGLPL
jgi:hypothetical protein